MSKNRGKQDLSKHNKQKLFEDEEEANHGELKINSEFAKKFEHNKRRELLEKGKEKYGEKAFRDDDD